MVKNIICLIISVILGIGLVFADIEHTVARGESIESIAEKYGITTEKLLEVNKDVSSLFYIGQKLNIPNVRMNGDNTSEYGQSNSLSNTVSPMERGLAEDAKRHFEHKEWGKAVKTYNKLIKDYPKSIYYYNRALSNFNNNKNRQAVNDFEKALSMEDCTSSMRKNGPKLLAEAQRRHREWKDKQANLIEGAILGVAALGLTTWAAVESSKIESSDSRNMNASQSSISSADNYINDESASSTNYYNEPSKSKKKEKCGFCGGKGSIVKSVPNFGIDKEPWCDECGKKVVSGHYHQTCTHCNGTGER